MLLRNIILPCKFGFDESWRTFYWDSNYIRESLNEPEGFIRLCSDFFMQFTASPILCIALSCTLMLAVAWIIYLILRKWMRRFIALTASAILAVILVEVTVNDIQISSADRFRKQMCLLRNGKWEEIIESSIEHKPSNLLELNILHLALAEKGELAEYMRKHPTHDVNTLFVLNIETPYVAALLSEIYWSMGEISMSQYYAFQANEKLGNLSPWMLQRLVLTNIVFGEYATADKYLSWLDHTLYYRKWVAQYRKFLWNDEAVEADPILGVKRKCIPQENCFPSAQSSYYDMQQLVERLPQHKTSAQYLEALKIVFHVQ